MDNQNQLPIKEIIKNKILEVKVALNNLENIEIKGTKIKDYGYYGQIERIFYSIYPDRDVNYLLTKLGFDLKAGDNLLSSNLYNILGVQIEDANKLESIKKAIPQILNGGKENAIIHRKIQIIGKEVYFTEIEDLTSVVNEFVEISSKQIKDEDLNRFILVCLYQKSYEFNKKILIDAYRTITGKDIDVEKDPKTANEALNYMTEKYHILTEAMDRVLRNDTSHAIYRRIGQFNTQQLFDMSIRNFITASAGLIVKSRKDMKILDDSMEIINSMMNLFQ